MIPLVVIRPQPGCDATVAAACALGLPTRGFPLFAVRAAAWEPPAPDTFDALLLGSANALRHAGPALAAYRGKPAYAVGAATAETARAAGLDVVAIGKGGLQRVLPMLRPGHRRLLRLSGRERTMLVPPANVSIDERVVYASEPLPMPAELRRLIARPALVLLHSAEAARHFAALCDDGQGDDGQGDDGQADRSVLSLAALGPRIAQAAGQGWRAVAWAERAVDTALLALARQMCQDPRG